MKYWEYHTEVSAFAPLRKEVLDMEKWIMFLSLLFLTLVGGTVIAVVIPAWIKMIVYLVKELMR